MPAKAPIDENVKFLFSCLVRSDYKSIDFSRVAADFSINPAAARMRWSRLKRTINMDDIAASILEGKKRKIKGHSTVKGEKPIPKVEDTPSESRLLSPASPPPPLSPREGPPPSSKVLFNSLPEPPARVGEQDSIAVLDEVVSSKVFTATQVPHLPRLPNAVPKPPLENLAPEMALSTIQQDYSKPESALGLWPEKKVAQSMEKRAPVIIPGNEDGRLGVVPFEPSSYTSTEQETGREQFSETNPSGSVGAVVTQDGTKKRKVEAG